MCRPSCGCPQISGDYFVRSQAADGSVPACRRAYRLQIAAAAHAPPQVSLQIAADLPFTTQRMVTLTLSIIDAGAGIGDLLVANDSSLTSGAWHVYTQTLSAWELADGDGMKTVYARVRDGAGNVSAIVSDTIVLDSTPPRGSGCVPVRTVYRFGIAHPLEFGCIAGYGGVSFARCRGRMGRMATAPVDHGLASGRSDLGQHRVELQVRDGAGNVSEISTMDILLLRSSALLPLILR